MPSVIYSRAPLSINAAEVSVEVHLSGGLPNLTLVGLPEKAVKESKDRVRAALQNSGLKFPQKHITINLAPADLPKESTRYDLAIALAILAADGQIPLKNLENYEWHGELALSGEIRAVKGILPCALEAKKANRIIVVSQANAAEAALTKAKIWAAKSLKEIVEGLFSEDILSNYSAPELEEPKYPDFSEVIGQHEAKRVLLIAAAGGHHILMSGPPGTGKSMMASRFVGILPPMSEEEAISTASVWSVSAEGFKAELWKRRPFRSPHHSSSSAALVGGGSVPQPGEISLSHNGVLFLDEFPEFDRKVLEMLREPLETGKIEISRAKSKAKFPAEFQLIAAMNPCPCGYFGDPQIPCTDSPEKINRYRQKISGPLLDRIDIHLEIARLSPKQLRSENNEELNTENLRALAMAAREIQIKRQGKANAKLEAQEIKQFINANSEAFALLDKAAEKMQLSMRAYHRTLKVARTIADLANCPQILKEHISEALAYRRWKN